MTLLRPQTINLMADKRPLSRRELGLYGLQLVRLGGMAKWVFKKPMILRNPPYTVGPYAHDGQLEVRLKFAEVAHGAKGSKGVVYVDDLGRFLTAPAAHIHKAMKGYRAPSKIPEDKLPSKLHRTAYTEADLRKILEERKKAKR
jgi:hypothetical protein